MKAYLKITLAYVLVIMASSCQQKSQPGMDASGERASSDAAITLTKAQTKAANIELGLIEKREMSTQIQVNGYFDVPPQNKAKVSAYHAGYVKTTSLLVGDQVRKNQILVVLENPEFIKMQQNFMEVSSQLDYLKEEYERKKVLEQEKITAKKNLLKAEADYKIAHARYQGMKKELQMMGINPDKVEAGNYTSTMAVRSPISGSITKVNAMIGKYIVSEEVIMEIVNTDHLHVELEVFEKDILKVQEGQKISVRIPSLNDGEYQGEIYLVGKALDEDTRTVNVHAHVIEKQVTFLPGMYVEAFIKLASDSVTVLPEASVISIEDKQFIYVLRHEDQDTNGYELVEVHTGKTSEGWVEVIPIATIAPDQPVVVKGVYYLSSYLGEEGS